MATHVLIVEGDAALSARMRGALEERGFSVQETPDGRTCLEVARQAQPACVILAVDLPAGQNGYILCGKFKKDEDLRELPVAIVGSPEGFAQHSKLKNRADAYLAKPLQLDSFVDRIAQLTGQAAPDKPTPAVNNLEAEEATVSGDPDLDLIDAAFDTSPLFKRPPPEHTVTPAADSAFSSVDSLGAEEAPEHTAPPTGDGSSDLEALTPRPSDAEHAAYDLGTATPLPGDAERPVYEAEAPAPTPEGISEADIDALGLTPSGDAPEMLRREVARLQAALEDTQARSFSSDVRIHQLEAELAGRAAVEEDPGADGRSARDQVLRRDRDIVRLKTELHGKEQELADLRDQATQLEQQNLEMTGEVSRRDAQIKTLQSRAEQERKRLEQALERTEAAAREAQDQAVELQAAIEAASARADAAEQEAGDLRGHAQSLEAARDQSEGELAAARRDRELNRAHADGAQRQLSTLQAALEQSQSDLSATREQLSLRDAARADELGALQSRIRELEAVAQKHEERVARLYTRLKAEERAREKAARAVAMAGQLLNQSGAGTPAVEKAPDGDDEPAAASR